MSAIKTINPNADVIGSQHSLMMNIMAAKGLADIVKSNLGPKGTMKMLVSGAGDIKVTKDGKVLLDEMHIQHPTAAIIARTATAQDDITGDGTTSNVLLTGELLSQAQRYLNEGVHPRVLVDGFELAREKTLAFLDEFSHKLDNGIDRELVSNAVKTSLRTKLYPDLADHLSEIVVSAVECIRRPEEELDLHMIEIMHMRHQSAFDTRFVDGLVLDHGARHPDMPKRMENAYILILNVSLEYEKTETNSGFFYKSADERARLAAAERKFTDDKVNKIIEFKKKMCDEKGNNFSFVVINQKGIDPVSLDAFQKNGISGIRRAKRRNMERLARACGGYAVSAVDDLSEESLGFAKLVYEHELGDDKYTFVEGCRNPNSCTILIKGPNDHTIRQIKDAVQDGLKTAANVFSDKSVTAGAGAFEVAAHLHLLKFKNEVQGRAKIGVQAFADAMLVTPKTLAQNSGLDAQSAIIDLLEEALKGNRVGLDIDTGKTILPEKVGIWDNTRVKKQFLHLGSLVASKLLLVDEVMRAGRKMGKE